MQQSMLELRAAQPDDAAAVRELTMAAYQEYATIMTPTAWAGLRGVVERTLDNPDPRAWRIVAVAPSSLPGLPVRGGTLQGTVLLYPPATDAYLGLTGSVDGPEVRLLAVDPRARRHGVGRALMDECVRLARSIGATELGLHTSASLRAAIAMYERMGFERVPEHDFQPPGAELVTAYRLRL